MITGRLGAVQKLEDRHRKYYCVMNDVAKHRQEYMANYISKEQKDFGLKREKSMAKVRKKFVKRIALQKCLQENRVDSSSSHARPLFGHYHGRPLQSFSKDIDVFLADRHPKYRKKKMCQSLLEKGEEKGKLLGLESMTGKVRNYLTEKWGVKYAQISQKNAGHFTEDMIEKRRLLEKATEKLPPIFSLYKVSLRPLEHRRRDSVVPGLVLQGQFLNENKLGIADPTAGNHPQSEAYFRVPTKRERFERLTKKQYCTKPACAGYQGEYTRNGHGEGLTLPLIQQNSFLVRSVSP